jgi:RES domain-containing protein
VRWAWLGLAVLYLALTISTVLLDKGATTIVLRATTAAGFSALAVLAFVRHRADQ